jgi:c-di-AMP phosphodiesterase-like protein
MLNKNYITINEKEFKVVIKKDENITYINLYDVEKEKE